MTPREYFTTIVEPTLQWMAPLVGIEPTDQARVLLMAIAGTESNWTERLQGGGGPARGRHQFEGGDMSGLAQVLMACPIHAKAVCTALVIPYDRPTIFQAVAWNDTLDCAMARLLLWQHPPKLPALGDVQGAYQYYLDTWHPGAPRPAEWSGYYDQSLAAIGGREA